MPVPQKKSRVECFKRLLETIFSRPESPVFDSSPRRRRAEGTASRKCRRSPARILLSNCPRAQNLPAVGGKKKRSGQLFGVPSKQQGASHRSTRAAFARRRDSIFVHGDPPMRAARPGRPGRLSFMGHDTPSLDGHSRRHEFAALSFISLSRQLCNISFGHFSLSRL
jgi:hypothetical protein